MVFIQNFKNMANVHQQIIKKNYYQQITFHYRQYKVFSQQQLIMCPVGRINQSIPFIKIMEKNYIKSLQFLVHSRKFYITE